MTTETEIRYLTVEPPIGEGWDEQTCMRCADVIDPDDECVSGVPWNPDAEDEMERRMVGDMHTWCALKDGFRLVWSDRP